MDTKEISSKGGVRLALAIAVSGMIAGCSAAFLNPLNHGGQKSEDAISSDTLKLNGRIEAIETKLATSFPATVTEVLVKEGDRVSKGQVLLRFDDNGVESQLSAIDNLISAAEREKRAAQRWLAEVRAASKKVKKTSAKLVKPAPVPQTVAQTDTVAKAELESPEAAMREALSASPVPNTTKELNKKYKHQLAKLKREYKSKQTALKIDTAVAKALINDAKAEQKEQSELGQKAQIEQNAPNDQKDSKDQTAQKDQKEQSETANTNAIARKRPDIEALERMHAAMALKNAGANSAGIPSMNMLPANMAQALNANSFNANALNAGALSNSALSSKVSAYQIEAKLAEADAAIAKAKATREQLVSKKNSSTLVSRADGVVSACNINPGEFALPGQVLIRISSPNRVYLRAFVAEGELSKVKIGQKAQVYLDGAVDKVLNATITSIDETASFTPESVYFKDDRVKQVFGIKLRVDNTNGIAKPGMPADAVVSLIESRG